MMTRHRIKKLSYQLSRPFPLKWFIWLSGQNFIYPFYHLVSDNPSPCVKHLYPVHSKNQFVEDLDFLLSNFRPAEFNKVLDFARDGNRKGKPQFFLTFDDGFSECHDVIAPILKEKGIQAAFFINPAFVGNKRLSHRQKVSLIIEKIRNTPDKELTIKIKEVKKLSFNTKEELIFYVRKLTYNDSEHIEKIATALEIDFENELKKYQPYMDLSKLYKLQEDGFIIGSHSFDHPEYQNLSVEEMMEQVENSFTFLESNFNIKYRIFSFPFHDINIPRSFFDYLKTEANVAVSFGTSGIKQDEMHGHIHRIPMELKGFNGAEPIIRSEYFYYLAKSLFGKNLVKRR